LSETLKEMSKEIPWSEEKYLQLGEFYYYYYYYVRNTGRIFSIRAKRMPEDPPSGNTMRADTTIR